MSTKRILCKYFMHGACLRGDDCQFSHNWNDPANNVCTFYQRGVCSFGSKCRYDHVKLSRPQETFSTSANHLSNNAYMASCSAVDYGQSPILMQEAVYANSHQPSIPPLTGAWTQSAEKELLSLGTETGNLRLCSEYPDEGPICALAATGRCARGDSCPQLHGDLCPTCGKHCLHPFRPFEREEHQKQCERNQKRLEALRYSQEIECSVCLERVLSKPSVAERKFGLLSGCDHPFCISCIRGWRNNGHTPGMDIDTVVRACPVCRIVSHYVIPSVIWYSSQEEKEEIVNGYKAKLSTIDCRYFDFGNGNCPFGTSCFYKHAYRDGTTEEVKLRHLGAADGSTVIVKNIRLSDFFRTMDLRGGRSVP
eukprot:c27862_g1_i2 orf=886-1983(-)